ncbi:LysR substrate-binding domain-containing protein [Fictibacillus sp. NRS-1165]|uniref:LysR substrate-binding domain-containing protein n=1 Tax=Fictibacillus sp. NRS-1165 TaxID=3144463 RepID=UPI003D1EC784
MYKYALQMTQLMEEDKIKVKGVENRVNETLMIGINTFSVTELTEILHQFKKQHSKVTYKIQQNESSHLCKLVRDRVVEMAIIRLPFDWTIFQFFISMQNRFT